VAVSYTRLFNGNIRKAVIINKYICYLTEYYFRKVEGKKTKRQAKNQVDGPSNERCRKEGEEMDAGETRQGMGSQGQMEISL
jgi:hypothetical protein